MISKKDIQIISRLRNNSRESLTRMSHSINIPVSTIYDRLQQFKQGLVKKYTVLIDYTKLGYTTRANIMIKVKREKRDKIKEYLLKHQNVNSFYKINNGYDFAIEVVFKQISEMETFLEHLDENFDIKKEVFYIIDDIRRETFLASENTLEVV